VQDRRPVLQPGVATFTWGPCPEGSGRLNQGGGRNRIDDRTALAAIAYVLQTGCAWEALPESFPISRATAHRRFAEWVQAGVMQALHQAMLDVLGAAGKIDWSRASVDAMHVRAVKGGT
jgi:transposase